MRNVGAQTGVSVMSIFKRAANDFEKIENVEGEIRGFVRRGAVDRQQQPAHDGETVADNLGLLLERVSLNSVQEIDRIIGELKGLKDRLQHDGEHIRREIAAYASLSHATIESSRIIAESLTHWRSPGAPRHAE